MPAPGDLWEQMDRLELLARPEAERPPNSFTSREFRERYNIGEAAAADRLRRLRDQGKIKMIARGGHSYYVILP